MSVKAQDMGKQDFSETCGREVSWISSQCSITGHSDCVRPVKFAGHPSKYLSHDLPNLAYYLYIPTHKMNSSPP